MRCDKLRVWLHSHIASAPRLAEDVTAFVPVFPPGTRAKALLASDHSQIERTPFFWRHYVRSFTIFFSKRYSGRLRSINVGAGLRSAAPWYTAEGDRTCSQLPKVLNFAEDAHQKNMSTFEADEHLQATPPLSAAETLTVCK
jgi:hypothetical protein